MGVRETDLSLDTEGDITLSPMDQYQETMKEAIKRLHNFMDSDNLTESDIKLVQMLFKKEELEWLKSHLRDSMRSPTSHSTPERQRAMPRLPHKVM